MSADEKRDRLMTKRAAAERLGDRHPRTLDRWAERGLLKILQIGGRDYVAESEVARLIAGAAPEPTPAK